MCSNLKRWLRYARPYALYFVVGPLCMIVEVIGEIVLPKLYANIVNVGIETGNVRYIVVTCLLMILMALLMMTGGVGGAYFASKASVNVAADVRRDVYAKIQKFSFANIDRFSTGSLITRLTNDVTQVMNMINMLMRMCLRAPGMLIGALIAAIYAVLCAALALPALADSVTDSISVCIGYFGWAEDEYVEKAKFTWQELDDWYGGALDTHEEFYSYSNGSGRTYLVYARGFYIRDLLDYAGVDVNSIASIDFFTKDHSNGAYRSFTKYALLDQPRYYFPNLAADPETGELYAWDGGDDLWVGAYQVEPMLALEDYTEWDTSGFDFESYIDESRFSTGNRFHLFFGQASPEEAATSSAAKYVYKILVTFSGTPVLSSEEDNLDLIVGSDHALHVTADVEDDALTDYVQANLQYASSDPSVVSVDQYGKLHVNAEGDAVITASFGESSVSVNVHVGSGGASGTGSTAGNGTEPGGEAASGTFDLPKPEETETSPAARSALRTALM